MGLFYPGSLLYKAVFYKLDKSSYNYTIEQKKFLGPFPYSCDKKNNRITLFDNNNPQIIQATIMYFINDKKLKLVFGDIEAEYFRQKSKKKSSEEWLEKMLNYKPQKNENLIPSLNIKNDHAYYKLMNALEKFNSKRQGV